MADYALASSPYADGERRRSGITGPRNFHIDDVDTRGRFALPEFFVGRRRTQAEQRLPFGTAEDAGKGAAAGDFDSLQLAPAAVETNEGVFFEGCHPYGAFLIEADAIGRF